MSGSVRVVRRRRRAAAVAVVGVLALAGCGGGGDSKDDASGGATSTTTEAKVTTTTEATATTEATTTTQSTLPSTPQTTTATLTAADMGGEWRVFPDEPTEGTGPASQCAEADPKGATKTMTAESQGDILQRGKLGRYVQTTTTQFPDAAAAEAYVQVRLGDAWIECQRALTEKVQPKDSKLTISVDDVERRSDDGQFRGTYSFLFDQEVDGKKGFTGSYTYHWLYRKGAFVVDAFVQVAGVQTDPKDLDDKVYDELVAGLDKVMGRVAA
jgi:hypothetical protein